MLQKLCHCKGLQLSVCSHVGLDVHSCKAHTHAQCQRACSLPPKERGGSKSPSIPRSAPRARAPRSTSCDCFGPMDTAMTCTRECWLVASRCRVIYIVAHCKKGLRYLLGHLVLLHAHCLLHGNLAEWVHGHLDVCNVHSCVPREGRGGGSALEGSAKAFATALHSQLSVSCLPFLATRIFWA